MILLEREYFCYNSEIVYLYVFIHILERISHYSKIKYILCKRVIRLCASNRCLCRGVASSQKCVLQSNLSKFSGNIRHYWNYRYNEDKWITPRGVQAIYLLNFELCGMFHQA
jgi:hypothetical protein